MPKPKIGLFYGNSQVAGIIKEQLPEADVTDYPSGMTGPHDEENLRETEILCGSPQQLANALSKCPKLKWIQTTSAGVDKILKALNQIPQKDKLDITITRNGETFCKPLSEYIISQILAVNIGQYKWHDQQKEGVYKREPLHTKPLSLSSVAILGMGCIGHEVARTCKSFGMKVWSMTRAEVLDERKSPDVDEYRITSDLPELLAECEYIVSILPSTDETRGLLSGDVFSHCKNKKTVFINVGRGDVTDAESLIKALRNGWLQYAILDVHCPEPLPADNPLWKEPGVIITPHIAGGFILHSDYLQDRAIMFVKQYRRYMNNEPLKYVVNLDRGY